MVIQGLECFRERISSLLVVISPHLVLHGWMGMEDPYSASCRLLETMGAASRDTPLEFWVRHVCILGHKEA